jgi:choline dehydrogenase-like flavoprotein
MLSGRLAGGGKLLMDRLTEVRHIAMWVQGCRAESVGEIGQTFGGRPAVRYTLSQADMVRFRAGLHVLARTHFAAGARAVIPCIHGLPYKLLPGEQDKIESAPLDPRAYFAILSHLFGGCTMGHDPSRSVCNDRGQVHGYDGLYVADASAIPTNLGVNPQHTIMALARHWAQAML